MTDAAFVVVSNVGSPMNPRTWSGTASNLIAALQRKGYKASGLDLTFGRYLGSALWRLYGKEYRRSGPSLLLYKLNLRLRRRKPEDTIFIHVSTTTFPLGKRAPRVLHTLYLDSTVHLEALYTISSLSDGQIKAFEEAERRSLAEADHIFTTSECARQDIIQYYSIPAERVTAAGTGKGQILCAEGEKSYSSCTTLFVAKDRFEEKGGVLLLDGFRLAQADDPRLKLIVVATEKYRGVVESVPGASFKTALPWDELQALFNQASLFAMPALYEPWGLVYVEALACRTPVLGMNRNALPELTHNGKYGFLMDEATPACVAEKLLDAYSNIDRLAAMGDGGQQYVKSRYSWDLTAATIVDALVAPVSSAASPNEAALPWARNS